VADGVDHVNTMWLIGVGHVKAMWLTGQIVWVPCDNWDML